MATEPFVKFGSSKEHYTADACVVWCFDDRFYKLLKAFGKQEGFGHIDLVKIAGGAKALAGDASPDRDFVLNQIKTSARLHGTKRVILMLHRDCGAYGGSKNFADVDAEKEQLGEKLQYAGDFIKGEFPDMQVDAYFADFDGLYMCGASQS
ncbi:MAG TPA: carbonic anhydrase [Candidatus Paceibacterota bacterium]|nr:carbonic anhydrase [Candidatus Paceibacterota bacterium]